MSLSPLHRISFVVFHIDWAALKRINSAFFNIKKRIVDRTNLAMPTLICNAMILARYRSLVLNNYWLMGHAFPPSTAGLRFLDFYSRAIINLHFDHYNEGFLVLCKFCTICKLLVLRMHPSDRKHYRFPHDNFWDMYRNVFHRLNCQWLCLLT